MQKNQFGQLADIRQQEIGTFMPRFLITIMTLEDLGYHPLLEQYRMEHQLKSFETGRVLAEHKERYIIRTESGEYEAEITGNLRFTAKSREDYPAVGDWVAATVFEGDLAIIHHILPRSSVIKRQAVGQHGEIQIIAANIDYAMLVQAADRDFNVNRLERYLTICYAANVEPVIVLTKTDLADAGRLSEIIVQIKRRIDQVPVVAISNSTLTGYDELKKIIEKGKTYCMLGSSGVGKSTLLNNLSGQAVMRTDAISSSTGKGRHVTSHRELTVLESGGILIDNPGMREVGIADTAGGLEATFDRILSLAGACRYADCTHVGEAGCAVLEALRAGVLDEASYENWLKLERERAHYESTVADRRRKDRKFGKMLKDYQKRGGGNE